MKNIKSGIIYNIVYHILNITIPLITSPYLARFLGAESIGEFQFQYSMAYYLFLFAMLGVNVYGNREIAKVRDNRKERSKTFWQIFYIQFFLAIILTIMYLMFGFVINSLTLIYVVQILQILSACIDINWYAFALEEFKLTTIRSMVIKIITTIFIFIFIKSSDDIIKYACIILGGNCIGLMAIVPLVLKTTNFEKPDLREIKKHLKGDIILFLPSIASSVFIYMDKIMLGFFSNTTEVGFYSYAENISSIPCCVTVAITTVMLPRISNMIKNGKKEECKKYLNSSLLLVTAINIAMMFGLMAVSDIFVPWYLGEKYMYTAILVNARALYIVLNGITLILKSQWLIPLDRDKAYSNSIILGSVANLLLNIPLIIKYQAVGASIATVIAFAIIAIVQLYYAKDAIKIKSLIYSIVPFFVLGFFMYASIKYLNLKLFVNFNVLIKLFSDVVLGIIIYVPIATLYLLFNKKNGKIQVEK